MIFDIKNLSSIKIKTKDNLFFGKAWFDENID